MSVCTRCCLYRLRRRWSRIVATDVALPTEIPCQTLVDERTEHAIINGAGVACSMPQVVATMQKEARLQKPSSHLCAWLAWLVAALAVTTVATSIWSLIAVANGINLEHAKHMIPVR